VKGVSEVGVGLELEGGIAGDAGTAAAEGASSRGVQGAALMIVPPE